MDTWTISDYIIVAIGVTIIVWHITVSWKKYTRNCFVYKLRHGDDWERKLFPERFTRGGAPR